MLKMHIGVNDMQPTLKTDYYSYIALAFASSLKNRISPRKPRSIIRSF